MRFGFAPILFEMAVKGDHNQASSRAWNGNCSQGTLTLGAIPSLGWSLFLCLFLICLIHCQHLVDWTVGRAHLIGCFPFFLSQSHCLPYEWTGGCVVFAPWGPACKEVSCSSRWKQKCLYLECLCVLCSVKHRPRQSERMKGSHCVHSGKALK